VSFQCLAGLSRWVGEVPRAWVTRVTTQETDEAQRFIEVRKARQELLHQKPAVTLWVVLDEAVLRRRPGAMWAQLARHCPTSRSRYCPTRPASTRRPAPDAGHQEPTNTVSGPHRPFHPLGPQSEADQTGLPRHWVGGPSRVTDTEGSGHKPGACIDIDVAVAWQRAPTGDWMMTYAAAISCREEDGSNQWPIPRMPATRSAPNAALALAT
jgi:hypothetical protein